jgi:hypothetical protein
MAYLIYYPYIFSFYEMDEYNSAALFEILVFDMTLAAINFAFVVVALLSL